jgi:hypothetical protein
VTHVRAAPLPEKNYGNLRGGKYPFLYDPGYGLPVVREVATYGGVLSAIREGRVSDILWFIDRHGNDVPSADGRCLVVYDSGRVAQSALLPSDPRLRQAMTQWGVRGEVLPAEPKDVPAIAEVGRPRENHIENMHVGHATFICMDVNCMRHATSKLHVCQYD